MCKNHRPVLNFYVFYTNSFEILDEVVVLVKEDVIFVDEDGVGLLQLSLWQHVTLNDIDITWDINSQESKHPWKSIKRPFMLPNIFFLVYGKKIKIF